MLKSYSGHLFRPEKKIKAPLNGIGKSLRTEIIYLQKTVAGSQKNITFHWTVMKQEVAYLPSERGNKSSCVRDLKLECNKNQSMQDPLQTKEEKNHHNKNQQNKEASLFHFLIKLSALAFAIIFMVVKCLKGVNSKRALK